MTEHWDGKTERRQLEVWRWRLLTLWIIIFTFATIFSIYKVENARVASCRQGRTDLTNIIKASVAQSKAHFTVRQKKEYNKFLTRFSPDAC